MSKMQQNYSLIFVQAYKVIKTFQILGKSKDTKSINEQKGWYV